MGEKWYYSITMIYDLILWLGYRPNEFWTFELSSFENAPRIKNSIPDPALEPSRIHGYYSLSRYNDVRYSALRVTSLPGGNQVSPLSLPGPSDLPLPKTRPRRGFFRMTFPYLFWPNLSPKRPPKATPFCDPNRPKISLRHVLRPYLVKNVPFRKV